MQVPQLEYPKTQNFAIPYITEFFYPISAVLVVLLATLNVAIAGNDVISELKDNPNNTDSKWWAPRWIPESISPPTVPGPCQPLTIAQRATIIRTSSSLPIFSYTLLNGLGKYQNGTPRWYDSIEYNAQPLENCEVRNITARIDFRNRGHVLTSDVICKISQTNDKLPPTLKFSTSFSRMANTDLGPDDIIDYISSYVVPRASEIQDAESALLVEGSTPLNMLGVLDAFGSDLLKILWARKWSCKMAGNASWPDQAVATWTSDPDCQREDSERRCRLGRPGIGGIGRWYSNTKGSLDYSSVYLQPMNTTLFNYFVAMRDAIHLDMGNVDSANNIYLNKAAFKAHIHPDPYMRSAASLIVGHSHQDHYYNYTATEFWTTCTWGWGCLNGTWTDALLDGNKPENITRGLPLALNDSFGPTVIDLKYVCPVFKPKATGSLIVAVFIGTFSMYTALYGVFMFIAPQADEWYRKKQRPNCTATDLEDSNLHYAYRRLPGSSSPHKTTFDVNDLYQQYGDVTPRNYPEAYPPSAIPGNNNSTLPRGAYLPIPSPLSLQFQRPGWDTSSTNSRRSQTTRFINTTSDLEEDMLLRRRSSESNEGPRSSGGDHSMHV